MTDPVAYCCHSPATLPRTVEVILEKLDALTKRKVPAEVEEKYRVFVKYVSGVVTVDGDWEGRDREDQGQAHPQAYGCPAIP